MLKTTILLSEANMLSENLSSTDNFLPREHLWQTDNFPSPEKKPARENISSFPEKKPARENISDETADENDVKIYKTRLLLTLWDLAGENTAEIGVKKSELTGKVKHKKQGKKIGKYQTIYQELEREGAIKIESRDRNILVFITEKGEQMLGEGLKNPKFYFEGPVVPTRFANVLLRWIRFCTSSKDWISE